MKHLPYLRRIGLIGDVHGEAELLKQVIQFLQSQGATTLFCTGDVTDGYGDVDRCFDLLLQHRVHTVLGNHDRWCIHGELRNRPECTDYSRLSQRSQQFLLQLPKTQEFSTARGGVLLCHGIGENDMGKVLPDDSPLILQRNLALQTVIRSQRYRYLLNGHSHYRMARTIEGLTVVNAGTIRGDHQPGFVLLDFEADWARAYDITQDRRIVEAEPLIMPMAIAAS